MSPLSEVLEDPTSVLHQLHGTYKGDDFPGHVTQYFKQLFGSETQMSLVITALHPDHSAPKYQPFYRYRSWILDTTTMGV